MYRAGKIAPLVINPGELNDSKNFYTDSEFAEFLGITLEEFLRQIEKQKLNSVTLPKGTI